MAASTPALAAFTPGGMTPRTPNIGKFSPGVQETYYILSPKYNAGSVGRSPLYSSS